MRILIMGLPGSGKTTLAEELVKLIPDCEHLNADRIRQLYNDWDFSPEGRTRQAVRMRTLADELLQNSKYVVADFVAPNKVLRGIYEPAFSIWMDTIAAGRFEDTNRAWQVPERTEYAVKITQFTPVETEAARIWNLIQRHQQG